MWVKISDTKHINLALASEVEETVHNSMHVPVSPRKFSEEYTQYIDRHNRVYRGSKLHIAAIKTEKEYYEDKFKTIGTQNIEDYDRYNDKKYQMELEHFHNHNVITPTWVVHMPKGKITLEFNPLNLDKSV